MERLPESVLWELLRNLSHTGVARLRASSKGFADKHAIWVRSLPTTASELRFRGYGDGCYWLRVQGRPVQLQCTGLGAPSEDDQGPIAVAMPGSRWNFCCEKSNRGGAGSGWHWHVTHQLHFEAEGKLSVWREDDSVGNGEEGGWSESAAGLSIRFSDRSFLLQRMVHGDAMYGETCAGFLLSAPAVPRPAAYLPLARPNFSTLPKGGTVHGQTIRTDFDAVRLLLPEMRIYCADFTFTRTQGSAYIVGSNGSCRTDYAHSLFGFAQGSCGPNAFARIDLRGTPFSVDCKFLPTGCNPRGAAKHSSNGQVVLVAGTGGQGACAPTKPGTQEAQYPCLDDGHADVLWQKGCRGKVDEPFVVQLKMTQAEENFQYGRCDTGGAPADWVP